MKTITVNYKDGTSRTFDPHEFYEEYAHDDSTMFEDADNYSFDSADSASIWADCVNTEEAIRDWDDLNLNEV